MILEKSLRCHRYRRKGDRNCQLFRWTKSGNPVVLSTLYELLLNPQDNTWFGNDLEKKQVFKNGKSGSKRGSLPESSSSWIRYLSLTVAPIYDYRPRWGIIHGERSSQWESILPKDIYKQANQGLFLKLTEFAVEQSARATLEAHRIVFALQKMASNCKSTKLRKTTRDLNFSQITHHKIVQNWQMFLEIWTV